MKAPLTNRLLGVGGDANTVSVTVRLPKNVVDYIDAHLDEQFIRNRSEFLQHWAQVGTRVSEDSELSEALDWALDREVQEPEPIEEVVERVFPGTSEALRQIEEHQLEALRSRVR